MTRRLAAIPVKHVRIPEDSLREVDQAWVAALAQAMAEEGQLQPIEVAADGARYALVFGLHRLLAADINRWKTIDAYVDAEGGDAGARRRRAIHENLTRRDLSWLDRAVHVAELHDLRRDKVGERRGGSRQQKPDRRVFGLADDVAAKVGLSSTTVEESLFVVRRIGANVRRRIARSDALARVAGRADLMALAKGDVVASEPDELERWQIAVLDLIADEDNDIATVADAIAHLAGTPKPSETERHWQLATNAYARLEGPARDRFLAEHEAEFLDWQRRQPGARRRP